MRHRIFLTAICVAMFSCSAISQEPAKDKQDSGRAVENRTAAEAAMNFYRLDFTISELEGPKTINKRSYSMTIRAGRNYHERFEQLRSGARVPVPTEGGKSFQYMDVGVNIDCHGVESARGLSLFVRSEISSLPGDVSGNPNQAPLVRQLRNDSSLSVPLEKVVQVYSADEPTSARRFVLDVKATKM